MTPFIVLREEKSLPKIYEKNSYSVSFQLVKRKTARGEDQVSPECNHKHFVSIALLYNPPVLLNGVKSLFQNNPRRALMI